MSARDRGIELVHAEIDGALPPGGKAELGALLLADPELRALRRDLRRTCAALDSAPLQDAPQDLFASVMESLPAASPPCEGRDVRRFRLLRQPTLRYAAAFAGGLIVSALAFQFAPRPGHIDPGELAGTIAAVTADPSRLELHLEEVSGTVRVEGPASSVTVVAKLAASRPVQVIARLDGEQLRLEGFAAPQHGQVARATFSPRISTAPARVELTIIDATTGDVLQTTTLRPTVPATE